MGDVTSYHLHNLKPGTTYDLKLYAQYDAGLSGVLPGQGTTRMYSYCICHMALFMCLHVTAFFSCHLYLKITKIDFSNVILGFAMEDLYAVYDCCA